MHVALVYMNNEVNVGRGAGYIASTILQTQHHLTFYDTYYQSLEKVATDIIDGSFDILMISSMSMLFPDAVRLIRTVKQAIPIPVLVGGIHATIKGETILHEHKEIDYLCVGEGESMVAEFLDSYGTDRMFSVQNLVYRTNGSIVANPIRPAESLDVLPPFAWRLFNDQSIVQKDSGMMYVDATRGCPYNCTYCCNGVYLSLYGGAYLRHRPVEKVIEDLHVLRDRYHPSMFYFGDEMILAKKEYARSLFMALHEELHMPYGCMVRVEHIDNETADMFAQTGCRYIAMGVESGDEEFRKNHLNRHMSNDQIRHAFQLVHERDIFTSSFNMIGYPFPYDDRLTEATYELNRQLQPGYVQISVFYPLPGTVLHTYCVDNDLIDLEKAEELGNYFSDSPLRGVNLHETLKSLHWRLNPRGFRSDLLGYGDGGISLRDRLERAAYTGNPVKRLFGKAALNSARQCKQLLRAVKR